MRRVAFVSGRGSAATEDEVRMAGGACCCCHMPPPAIGSRPFGSAAFIYSLALGRQQRTSSPLRQHHPELPLCRDSNRPCIRCPCIAMIAVELRNTPMRNCAGQKREVGTVPFAAASASHGRRSLALPCFTTSPPHLHHNTNIISLPSR